MGHHRIKPEGCWSWCGTRCILEQHGMCRSNIPQYEMPAPNQSAGTLAEVVYGSREYETEIAVYERAYHKWWSSGCRGVAPPDWRKSLEPADPLAAVPVNKMLDKNGKCVIMWDAYQVENAIRSDPAIIAIVADAAEYYRTTNYLADFVLKRISEALQAMGYRNRVALFGEDFQWKLSHFKEACPLIAHWCVQEFFWEEEEWAVLLVKYNLVTPEKRARLRASQQERKKRELANGVVLKKKGRSDEREREIERAERRREREQAERRKSQPAITFKRRRKHSTGNREDGETGLEGPRDDSAGEF